MPLQHGPWIAALAAVAVTPGGLWLLAPLLEHRLMGFRTGFLAVLLGDPLLALAVALGMCRMGAAPRGGGLAVVPGPAAARR
ncbi:hypothetical protein ACFCX0_38155 [Streptomyces sp. NPDC056352]|uniref:hypothetical protein n=1 Tax=Streptomyces sp. NPDC056352 TaxID=3345791 RepID=UPI0035DA68AA